MTEKKPFKPTKYTLIFLLLAAMMTLMGGAAVAPALPLISLAFPETPEAVISLIVTLPSLAIALTGYFIGQLSDRFGRVPILLTSLVVFGLSGVSGFFLESIAAILISRVILGIGIAGIITATTALITEYYTGADRTKVLGYQAAAMGLGVLILEIGGGVLTTISWREPFLIYLAGMVIFVGALFTIKKPDAPPIDRTHFATARKDERSFTLKPVFIVYVTIFLGMLLMFALPTKLPYLLASLNDGSGASYIASGVILGFMGLVSAVAGLFYWRVAGRLHRLQVIVVCFILFGMGFALAGSTESLILIAAAAAFVGIGNGFLLPTMTNWIAGSVPVMKMGAASGGFTVSLNVGQFASSLIAVPILILVADSYAGLFLVLGGIGFVIAAAYFVSYLRVAGKSAA